MEPHVAAFAEDEEESGSPEAEEDASDMDGSDASSSSDALSSTLLNVPTTDAEFSAALGAFLRTFPGSPLRPAIVELPGGGTLRGVVAERALAPGECVLRVPWAFVITAQKAAESWGMTDFEPALSEHQALALFLCYEASLGERSKWKPYIDSLPKDHSGVPASWSSSPLLPAGAEKADERINAAGDDHPLVRLARKRDINTRIFSLNLPSHHANISFALVPGADFLNHLPAPSAPHLQVTYHPSGPHAGCYHLAVPGAVAAGQQVFNWYGHVGSVMGFCEWGFVPFVGRADDPERPDRAYIEVWEQDDEMGGERVRIWPLPAGLDDGPEPNEQERDYLFVHPRGAHDKLLEFARRRLLQARAEENEDPVTVDGWIESLDRSAKELVISWCGAWRNELEAFLAKVGFVELPRLASLDRLPLPATSFALRSYLGHDFPARPDERPETWPWSV
ncbi:hypothetical protein DFJ74DRAFT_645456 [Hyaloraphidium curvatum]|nr:hypothetical protein DFJ74DRAFT_645456 [Hyaloraphidium curvatum]